MMVFQTIHDTIGEDTDIGYFLWKIIVFEELEMNKIDLMSG